MAYIQNAAHPAALPFVVPDPALEGRFLSSCEKSDKGSTACLALSFEPLGLDVILVATGSFGGGGSTERIFPDPLGGGARPKGFGLPMLESPTDFPEESIPVPPAGLCFTFIRMVSPSFNL